MPVAASPLGPLPALSSLTVRVVGCPSRVSLRFARRYAIPCGPCVSLARSSRRFGSAPRVCAVCVLSCSRGVHAPPPPWVGVARALRAVPVQGAGRAVPGGSCPSAFPAPIPCSAYLALGRVARSRRPLALLGVAHRPAGRPAFVSWLCALWGGTRALLGGASCRGLGRLGLGARPRPTACPWGVQLGPATH